MKKSTKAVLWSGLAFPGTGHFFLKHYLRGMILFIPALISISLYTYGRYVQVMFVWDRIESGAVAPDPIAIATLLDNVPQAPVAEIAFWVFVVAWGLGMVDAYLLGRSEEANDTSPTAK